MPPHCGFRTAPRTCFRASSAHRIVHCPDGHDLLISLCPLGAQICDRCRQFIYTSYSHRCAACDFDLCKRCYREACKSGLPLAAFSGGGRGGGLELPALEPGPEAPAPVTGSTDGGDEGASCRHEKALSTQSQRKLQKLKEMVEAQERQPPEGTDEEGREVGGPASPSSLRSGEREATPEEEEAAGGPRRKVNRVQGGGEGGAGTARVIETLGGDGSTMEEASAEISPTERWRLSMAAYVAQRMASLDTPRLPRLPAAPRLDMEPIYPFPRTYA